MHIHNVNSQSCRLWRHIGFYSVSYFEYIPKGNILKENNGWGIYEAKVTSHASRSRRTNVCLSATNSVIKSDFNKAIR